MADEAIPWLGFRKNIFSFPETGDCFVAKKRSSQ